MKLAPPSALDAQRVRQGEAKKTKVENVIKR